MKRKYTSSKFVNVDRDSNSGDELSDLRSWVQKMKRKESMKEKPYKPLWSTKHARLLKKIEGLGESKFRNISVEKTNVDSKYQLEWSESNSYLDESVSINSSFAINDETDDVLSFAADQKLSHNASQESISKVEGTSDASSSISECSNSVIIGEIWNRSLCEKQEDCPSTWWGETTQPPGLNDNIKIDTKQYVEPITTINLGGVYRKLSSIIKETNERFIKDLEDNYMQSDPKLSRVGLSLAKVYIEGKRVPRNLNRVFEILSSSTQTEAKYLLMELAAKHQLYSDVYYYSQFLTSWFCEKETKTKKTMESRKDQKKAIIALEGKGTNCFKHLADDLMDNLINEIGRPKANAFQFEGWKLSFAPYDYNNYNG